MRTEREMHTAIFRFFGVFNQQLIEEISEVEAMFSEELEKECSSKIYK